MLSRLAAIGSRTAGFNHDIASKIQGMMMAIDEVLELATKSDVKLAAETAHAALGELGLLLQQSRALTKAPVASRIAIKDLFATAATRVGVSIRGALPAGTLAVAVPLTTQGLSLVFEAASGTDRLRTIEIAAKIAANRLEVAFSLPAVIDPDVGTDLALATWIIAREGGELRCDPHRLIVRLPVVQ